MFETLATCQNWNNNRPMRRIWAKLAHWSITVAFVKRKSKNQTRNLHSAGPYPSPQVWCWRPSSSLALDLVRSQRPGFSFVEIAPPLPTRRLSRTSGYNELAHFAIRILITWEWVLFLGTVVLKVKSLLHFTGETHLFGFLVSLLSACLSSFGPFNSLVGQFRGKEIWFD